jgi:hypothetical protein
MGWPRIKTWPKNVWISNFDFPCVFFSIVPGFLACFGITKTEKTQHPVEKRAAKKKAQHQLSHCNRVFTVHIPKQLRGRPSSDRRLQARVVMRCIPKELVRRKGGSYKYPYLLIMSEVIRTDRSRRSRSCCWWC